MKLYAVGSLLRDALLMLAAALMISWMPIRLGWGAVSGWLVGIPISIGAVIALSAVSILTELPILGKAIRVVLSYAALLALAVVLVGPMVWMLLISLHPPKSPIPPLNETLPVISAPVLDAQHRPVMVEDSHGNSVAKSSLRPDLHWENYDTVLNS